MAFQKTTSTIYSSVTVPTGEVDSQPVCKTTPRTFEASLVSHITFSTSTIDNLTLNVYGSADNTTFASIKTEEVLPGGGLEQYKATEFKANTYQFIRVTVTNAATAGTTIISSKMTEALI